MKNKYLDFLLLFLFFISVWNITPTQTKKTYNILDNFIPSGYMGDIKNIIIKKNFKDHSRHDSLCIKISYTPGDTGWGGVYWQYPANNWCKARGMDFSKSGFTKITFWVKGEKGGEEVKFRIGQDCGDSFVSDEITKRLTKFWTIDTISLKGKDLSNITGAFCWVIDSKANDGVVVFYLDDVQFEE